MSVSALEKYTIFQDFLDLIHSYYRISKVGTVCVADEANIFLSVYRSLKYNSFDMKKIVLKYSNLLNCLRYRFSVLVYNSSQAVEA